MRIRAATADDAPAVVELRRLVYPYLVRGVAATRRLIEHPLPAERQAAFVAEDAGRVVGWVAAKRNVRTADAGAGDLSLLHVHPGHRGRGAGAALYEAARAHLRAVGARRVRAVAPPEGLDFARARGFTPGREIRYAALDLRAAPGPPPVPPGIRLVTAAEVGPRLMYAAEAAGAADEPDDAPPDALTFDTWRHDVWDDPGLDTGASTAALAGASVAAFSLVTVDGDRMWSDMTATLPAHRGRGLALLAKTTALHRAAARGVVTAYTANDGSNAPMLAINERLGYRPVARQFACLTDLT
ncbi:GNAT family N-acetyltransferase [Spirilliplanes yamanashiensis]|uniref:Phosphinothricin acetyltransferase n=1 Tax=Spirilliplanes yamanashiensis TaxID=42233 RepID=A0A8J3Y2X4_9ACTN|nr:GNAT family N-acetyltransferase [Spirilliplanes yamanashiensis]MDP9814342.1 GNAT superfamily N-acetyltransferase [Spirilliplanes yamanashiensis]GIJ00676.1 phosphinothricin acetyltransferase [Spirilliplanes yamanashiensis]